jgi:hypothetical protein
MSLSDSLNFSSTPVLCIFPQTEIRLKKQVPRGHGAERESDLLRSSFAAEWFARRNAPLPACVVGTDREVDGESVAASS